MPANSERGVAARRREILSFLPTAPAPGRTASQIHQELKERGFEFTKRSVERDLNALSAHLECDKSEPDGWLWRQTRRFRRDDADDGVIDALNLRLIETSLRPLLPASVLRVLEPRLKAAAENLDGLRSRNAVSDWPNKVASELPMVPFIPPEIDEKVLDDVQYALIHDYVISCDYKSVAAGRFKKMKLHPLGLVQRGPVTYLIATIGGNSAPRTFALHRMRNVQHTFDTLQRPVGFSLQQFLADGGMQFGDCKPIRLVARVSPTLATVLDEAKFDRNQTLHAEEDGWFRLEATVQDTWQLRWWLLSKVGDIEVRQPLLLREQIKEKLCESMKHYDSVDAKNASISQNTH